MTFDPLQTIRTWYGNPEMPTAEATSHYNEFGGIYTEICGEPVEGSQAVDRYNQSLLHFGESQTAQVAPEAIQSGYWNFLNANGCPDGSPVMVMRSTLTERLRALASSYAQRIAFAEDQQKAEAVLRNEFLVRSVADAMDEGIIQTRDGHILSKLLPAYLTEASTDVSSLDMKGVVSRLEGFDRLLAEGIGEQPVESVVTSMLRTHSVLMLNDAALLRRAHEVEDDLIVERLKKAVGDLASSSKSAPLRLFNGRRSLFASGLKLARLTEKKIIADWDFMQRISGDERPFDRFAESHFHVYEDIPDVEESVHPGEILEGLVKLFGYPVFNKDVENRLAAVFEKVVGRFSSKLGVDEVQIVAPLLDGLLDIYQYSLAKRIGMEEIAHEIAESEVAQEIASVAEKLGGTGNPGGTPTGGSGTPPPPTTDSSGGGASPSGSKQGAATTSRVVGYAQSSEVPAAVSSSGAVSPAVAQAPQDGALMLVTQQTPVQRALATAMTMGPAAARPIIPAGIVH